MLFLLILTVFALQLPNLFQYAGQIKQFLNRCEKLSYQS